MNCSHVLGQTLAVISIVVTLIAWAFHTFVHGLDVSFQIACCGCLVITNGVLQMSKYHTSVPFPQYVPLCVNLKLLAFQSICCIMSKERAFLLCVSVCEVLKLQTESISFHKMGTHEAFHQCGYSRELSKQTEMKTAFRRANIP